MGRASEPEMTILGIRIVAHADPKMRRRCEDEPAAVASLYFCSLTIFSDFPPPLICARAPCVFLFSSTTSSMIFSSLHFILSSIFPPTPSSFCCFSASLSYFHPCPGSFPSSPCFPSVWGTNLFGSWWLNLLAPFFFSFSIVPEFFLSVGHVGWSPEWNPAHVILPVTDAAVSCSSSSSVVIIIFLCNRPHHSDAASSPPPPPPISTSLNKRCKWGQYKPAVVLSFQHTPG